MSKTFDLIIPCFNPRLGWEKSVIDAVADIELQLGQDILTEIFVVDDGSTEGFSVQTESLLWKANSKFRVLTISPNKGKGNAVRTGVLASSSAIQIYTDIDFPYLNSHVVQFYNKLNNGEADIIVASRGSSYYEALSPFRKVLSRSMQTINKRIFSLAVSDTQGGLKGFNARGREVFLQTSIQRYLFDLEFVQKATRAKLHILPVEVKLKNEINLPTPSFGILVRELANLFRILFRF